MCLWIVKIPNEGIDEGSFDDYYFAEPECGTSDKLLLLGCEDGSLRCIDVRNREKVSYCILVQ
jgi:hypothetical protein